MRLRIAQALEAYIQQHSLRDVANRFGIAPSTISRRDADPRSWPASDLCELAVIDRPLRDAIRDFLYGTDEPEGDAGAAIADLHLLLAADAQVMSVVSMALQGNRILPLEAAALIESITTRREFEDSHVLPDLRVIARGAHP